jgi:hypothetical protein
VGISFWHGGANGGSGPLEHAIGALGYGIAGDAGAPLQMNLGPDTTSGANASGGADYTALRVSYLEPPGNLFDRPAYACFSEAEYVGAPGGGTINNTPTWDTFGPPRLEDDCDANTSAPPGPPGPPISQPQPTQLALNCPASVQSGQNIVVSGALTYTSGNGGGVGGRPVVVNYNDSAIEHTLTTDPNGLYTDVVTAGPPPTWTIEATFAGDDFALASSASCQVSIVPAPPPQGQPSTISLDCPTTPVDAHIGTLGVSGAITPERDGAPVTVVYTQPDGSTIVDQTSIISSGIFQGSYVDDITPEEPGTWHVQSSWPGDATYAGNSSLVCAVTVNPRPPP